MGRRAGRGARNGDLSDEGSSAGIAAPEAQSKQRQLAVACLLVFGTAVAVLLASDAFEFSWRYQLPALVTLPPAGASARPWSSGRCAVSAPRRRMPGRRRRLRSRQRPTRSPRQRRSPPGQAGPA